MGYEAAVGFGAKIVVTMDADGQRDFGRCTAWSSRSSPVKQTWCRGPACWASSRSNPLSGHTAFETFAPIDQCPRRHEEFIDPSTGYRAMTTDVLRHLDLRQDQFYVSEMILDATRKNFRVLEVPVSIRRRASGDSKNLPRFTLHVDSARPSSEPGCASRPKGTRIRQDGVER